MTRIEEPARPVPPDIILEDYLDDVELGVVKTGKEADVSLVKRRARDRFCLLARKEYRDRDERAFRNDLSYRSHRGGETARRDGRGGLQHASGGRSERLAMRKGTVYGRRVLARQWIDNEWSVLSELWRAGADVPYPVSRSENGILMQYVGDADQAAPRLANARVARDELPRLFDQMRANLRLIVRNGWVHADLSPYNVLLWESRLWLIDMPQAVPILQNVEATDFLHRDVVNICAWFTRKSLDVDADDLFVTLLNDMFEYQMEDMFLSKGS